MSEKTEKTGKTEKTRVGRNPFQQVPPKAASTTASAMASTKARTAAAPAEPMTGMRFRSLIAEAINDARRAELEAKARVAGSDELSLIGRIVGWLAVDVVARGYIFAFKAIGLVRAQ